MRFPRSAALPAALALLLLPAPLLAAETPETALTPTRVIYPGETLTPDAVEEVALRRAPVTLGAVETDPEAVAGKVARRTLLPGRLIPVSALREAYLVQQGTPVEAVFSDGALTISALAVPLQAGAAGDFIRLRNPDSGKVLSGTVMADGTVRVSDP